MVLALVAALAASLFVGTRAAASDCHVNAGIQYFSLPGFQKAAVIEDGMLSENLSTVFDESLPLAQRALAAQHMPTDSASVSVNVLFLEDDAGHRILCDAGNGPRPEFIGPPGRLVATLEAQGIPRESITHVLLTHGHPDHLGGVLRDANGTQAFPEAMVYLSRVEYEYWRGAGPPLNESDVDPFMQTAAEALANFVFDAIEDRLALFEFGVELLPGITAIGNGSWHTPGHTIYQITPPSGPELFYLGDTVLNEVLGVENPYFRSRFDADRRAGPWGRTALLDYLADRGALAIFGHNTFPATARIVRDGLQFRTLKLVVESAGGVETTCPA